MDCYVYYRVSPAAADAVRARVNVLFAAVDRAFSIQPRLQMRCGENGEAAADGTPTWMEIYRAVPPGFPTVLARLSRENGVDALLDGTRHIECFDDAPCA